MEIPKIIVFNGVEYALTGSKRYYISKSNTNAGRRCAKGLHVAVWEFYNHKTVPKGCHIHHKDGNPYNHDISNLECVPSRQHLSEHAKEHTKDSWYKEHFQAKGIALAPAWHRSEEGKEFHKKLGKMCWENHPIYHKKCKECGKEFDSYFDRAEFCSDKCGEKWRGHHRRIEYTATCVVCGKEFKGTKYKPSAKESKTCSKLCSNRLNWMHRKKSGL